MLLLLTACSETPSIAILSPEDDAVVCGTPLTVEVDVRGVDLVEPFEGAEEGGEEPGTGHVDVLLNGQDATMSGETTFVIEDVADGAWQLKVELSYADHTPVEPYAGDFLYLTVAETECSS